MRLIILIAILRFSRAVDRNLFKTCEQSSFCRRCRGVTGPSKYEVISDSLLSDPNGISLDMQNTENEHLFVLNLEVLEDNTFHFEINEKTPIKPRYRVTEVLPQAPKYKSYTVSRSSSEIIVASKSDPSTFARIQTSPYKIDFYYDSEISVTANGLGLMKFEHLRTKPDVLDPNEDPDSWEETFNGFIDTKLNGPEAVSMDFTFPDSEVLFGIPEHGDTFSLKTTVDEEPYRLFNMDVFEYEQDSRMAIYGSVPVIYGHGVKKTAGVFWLNSADTFVDIHDAKTSHFISEAGIIDVYVLLGPTPADTLKQFTKLTGAGNLPQMFSLGFHQSRWNYFTQNELLEVVDNFDKNDLPLDTIWLDIEYTDKKKYFTWDHLNFPTPLEMIETLNKTGRHLTLIIDPHIKKDLDYQFYAENKDRGFFVKDKTGADFEGDCWPGLSSYVDFFNPAARKFYADQYLLENFPESSVETGIWNDMNEPSVFNAPEITMFRNNIHFGDWEHRVLHNQYGLMHTMGTYDGILRRGNGKYRPFILTRAFFAGTQRYAAIWTGDNTADWSFLQASIKMCLSVSVGGISFCGSDIGGFFGDPETELQVRWYQTAAFQPFFRAHAHMDTQKREPYLLPEADRDIVRVALRKRYALLPLWYTMFYEHERFGGPVMRPMLHEFPLDKDGFNLDDQFMLGDKLLVRPVMEKGVKSVKVHFPSTETWYDTDDHKKIESTGDVAINVDATKIPVYQRGGSIIPKKEIPRKSSTWMVNDPISLYIAVDQQESAQGTLYIDDETSFDYKSGSYLYLQFTFANGTLRCTFIDKNANFSTGSRLDKIVVVGMKSTSEFTHARVEFTDGKSKKLELMDGNENFFTIQSVDLSLMEEWTITLSGSKRHFLSFVLLLIAFLASRIY